MATVNLEKLGIINTSEVYHNLSAPALVEKALARGEGKLADNGALCVFTGKYTGRSPKDKFIADEPSVHDLIDWNNENRPISPEKFDAIFRRMTAYLQNRELYVFDGFAGADPKFRSSFRVINELASQNLFIHQLLIRPTEAELESFAEDFTIIAAPGFKCIPELDGVHSEAAILLSFERKLVLIAGSQYAGEIKKSVFSVMNFVLPQKGVFSMHCSANVGHDGDSALFFGLSGTGKTTLSTDPKRLLIGDDEHGWDDNGVFNFEGGCYAKVINLDKESEPDIWHAIKRDALLENVTVDKEGHIDFADKSVTENTRVSYPIYFINNIVKPVSKGPAAERVIFLSADAFGVLPPVSILTPEQTKYYFLSGFTAKLAGTERGITEPTPTFSACFGAAFLSLHPTKYGEELVKKMKKAGAKAYLVNTGWNGTGKRISIKDTRGIIDAILDGSIDKAPTKTLPIFDFTIPTELPGVDTKILDPRDTYKNAKDWDVKAEDLANRFVKNFVKFTGNEEGKKLVAAGPKVK